MSGLKQSIVVVNQYTIKDGTGAGSRGATPGKYITRYMARELASEQITPVRKTDTEDFIRRYMIRSEAVEQLLSQHRERIGQASLDDSPVGADIEAASRRGRGGGQKSQKGQKKKGAHGALGQLSLKVRRKMRSLRRRQEAQKVSREGVAELKSRYAADQGDGGISFGHNGVSLSHERLHRDAAQIQNLFDEGKTVLKTVISFDHEYLVANGLVPDSMELGGTGQVKAGAYRGQLDQLKLRMAVQEGMDRLRRHGRFEDLRYVGVIQVDTSHVHAHLAIADAGVGRLAGDGTQRGKLSSTDMAVFRRGVDMFLDRHRELAHMSSSVDLQRQSVSGYIKRWAFESMALSSRAQFILACLPEDRTMWRASTNREEMVRANNLVRRLVETRLAGPDSPLPEAMEHVRQYAQRRVEREGIDEQTRRRLIDDGYERIIERAMNGVYSVLAGVSRDELVVTTPVLESMSRDYRNLLEEVAAESRTPMVLPSGEQRLSPSQFVLRLRSYGQRLEHHRTQRESYELKALSWEQARDQGQVMAGSEAMYEHYRVEADYHARAAAKYQHFLDFGDVDIAGWQRDWAKVEAYGKRLLGMRALRADRSIPKMRNEARAEQVGREIYGQPGGGLLSRSGAEGVAGRQVIDGRIERVSARYRQMVDELVVRWRKEGLGRRIESVAKSDLGDMDASDLVTVLSGQVDQSADPVGITRDDEKVYPLTDPAATVVVRSEPEFDFEDVKGVDMHDMGVDWTSDQSVAPAVRRQFSDLTKKRSEAADKAAEWLVLTGQREELEPELGEVGRELERMRLVSVEVRRRGVLRSLLVEAADLAARRRRMTAGEILLAEREIESRLSEQDRQEYEQHLAELESMAAEYGRKPLGRTVPLDSGLGPSIEAAAVRAVQDYGGPEPESLGE